MEIENFSYELSKNGVLIIYTNSSCLGCRSTCQQLCMCVVYIYILEIIALNIVAFF
jgi:hypothetical protein